LCDRLNAPSRWAHLGASHLRMVLGLTPDAQERMLAAANENRWTVKAFQHVIVGESATRVKRGGRRAEPLIAKSIKTVKRCLDDYRTMIGRSERLSERDIEQSMQLLEETRLCLEHLSQSLRAALAQSETHEPQSIGGLLEQHGLTAQGNVSRQPPSPPPSRRTRPIAPA